MIVCTKTPFCTKLDAHTGACVKGTDGPVVHPIHYNHGPIEVWDFIASQGLDFIRGNVVKYVSRAGSKSREKELEDLNKAREYLNKAIELKEYELAEETNEFD